ncbi:PREDICTED: uncharacterized protein LOC106887320 [Calidris pugnax]|uniref:uncharacterized protein LOC106887320 n=1 Tax=Calidris pugnax TaxID=198806 RepID=UPI00071C32B9|nr:PREDICTED: uncharacterized protein LOC106887320 [Calidris pugnax]
MGRSLNHSNNWFENDQFSPRDEHVEGPGGRPSASQGFHRAQQALKCREEKKSAQRKSTLQTSLPQKIQQTWSERRAEQKLCCGISVHYKETDASEKIQAALIIFFSPQTLVWHGRTWNRAILAPATTGNRVLDNPSQCKLSSRLRAFLWGVGRKGCPSSKVPLQSVGTAPVTAKVFGKDHEHLKAASEKRAWARSSPWGCSPEVASGRESALLLVISVHHSLNIRPYRKTRASCSPCPSCISPDVSRFKPWKLN